jgi:hypothetical protein
MSLPIISTTDAQSVDLHPWLLLRYESNTQAEVSLWSIDQAGMAMAIFSSVERAEQYRLQIFAGSTSESDERASSDWQVVQPTEIELGKWMVAHFQAGVKWLVLDPSKQDAKRLFAMADVLKGLRQRLANVT